MLDLVRSDHRIQADHVATRAVTVLAIYVVASDHYRTRSPYPIAIFIHEGIILMGKVDLESRNLLGIARCCIKRSENKRGAGSHIQNALALLFPATSRRLF